MPSNDMLLQPRFAFESPYLADYFGLWAIEERAFRGLVDRVQGANLHLHLQSAETQQRVSRGDDKEYQVTRDGIAVFYARGPLMKMVPSMADGTSTVRLRQQMRAAMRDPECLGGMLMLDTPGGTSKGNQDLAQDVAAFAAAKPLYAFVEDLCASAGVSIASQATKRFANQATAIYGAMGTYSVLYDESACAEKLGVKVHVIRAGEFKGMGEPGTQITEAQITEIQRVVNRVNEGYLETIARGLNRSVDAIRPLADGRVIMASDAVQQGLLDGVQPYDQTYRQLVAAVARAKTTTVPMRSTAAMADNPATLADLKATFPSSSAEWRESQLEAGVTLSSAAIAYASHVEAQAKAEREQHAKDLDAAKAAAAKKPVSSTLGHQPLTQANVGGDELLESGNPVEDFDAAVRRRLPKHTAATFEQRQAAIAYVARTQPDLHRAYIVATNAKNKKVQRLIEEKFESEKVAAD